LRRYGRPEDVAKAILFLSSEAAQFITGANIPVDCGFRNIMAGPQIYTDETGASDKVK
jgi:NAD(P)-dependent dehydrogenase (short-subunit alcohol dehydrogenase family)